MKLMHAKILLAIGVAIFILCILIFKINMQEVTGWILLGTMVVVILYTVETYEMRRVMIRQTQEMVRQTEETYAMRSSMSRQTYEMARQANAMARQADAIARQTNIMIQQTELRIRPLITVHFIEHKLFIENVGYGVAKNVKINKLEVEGDYEVKSIIFSFHMISAIMVGKRIELDKKLYTVAPAEGKTPVPEHLKSIGTYFIRQAQPLNIFYEDLMGRECSSKVECGAEGCKFLEIK